MYLTAPLCSCPRMQQWGLNTYLYGPKDDLKHRLLWREVYSPEEEGENALVCSFPSKIFTKSWRGGAHWTTDEPGDFYVLHPDLPSLLLSGQLRTLIAESQSRGLTFVYALSPGQDIVFSSSCDLTLLKRKLRQARDTHSLPVEGRLLPSAFLHHPCL